MNIEKCFAKIDNKNILSRILMDELSKNTFHVHFIVENSNGTRKVLYPFHKQRGMRTEKIRQRKRIGAPITHQ